MGAHAVASEKQGRRPITAITVAKGIRWDPWILSPVNTILHVLQIINAWDGDMGRQWIKSQWGPNMPPPMGQGQRPNGSSTDAPHGTGMGNAMEPRAS
eukprot:4909763-Karenia_brevis.AAC.1